MDETASCRVLLVEDDPIDHMAFERCSREQSPPWQYTWASSISEAKNFLNERPFDVLIIDYRLGDGLGLELTDLARGSGTPMIFVTGVGNEEIAVKAMRAGAYDYLIKDPERQYLHLLPSTVERSLQHKKMEGAALQAQRKIEKSLHEKEVLLKEIHHRVKNNLQIIASLLNMQSQRLDNEICRAALLDCHLRVQSMALIHEKLYESGDLSQVNFDAYIRSLAHDLFDAYHVTADQITLKVAVENIVMSMDKAIPFGLILNELMSNALKYAFPNGRRGEIRIELCSLPDKMWAFSFADNGVGLPPGFSPVRASSLGLQIVEALSLQLQGNTEWKNKEGSHFKLVFKE